MGAGYWVFTLSTRSLYWSAGYYRLLGLSPNSVMPDFSICQGMVHPDDRIDVETMLDQARHKEMARRVMRLINADGEMIWVEHFLNGQFDRNGALVAVFGVIQDVSARELQNRSAARDRVFLEALRALAKAECWQTGTADPLQLAAFQTQSLTAPKRPQRIQDLKAVHPDDRERFLAAWNQGTESRAPFRYRARIKDSDERYVVFETLATPLSDSRDNVIDWLCCSVLLESQLTDFIQADLEASHIRAGRALLSWSIPQLAQKSDVSSSTIKRMEKSPKLVKAESVTRIKETLEAAGIRFVTGADGRIWVSMEKIAG